MMWSISKRDLRVVLTALAIGLSCLTLMLLTACEKELSQTGTTADGNFVLAFPAGDFQKLNVMLFDAQGERAFDKVKTVAVSDSEPNSLSLDIAPGFYTVVAVGHSSAVSAAIKSPQMVQFTAKDGRKLTDTFLYCDSLVVSDAPVSLQPTFQRAVAMVRLVLTDSIPTDVTQMRFDYTGGSANVNPSTLLGTTKSTQSELRTVTEPLEVYTFPYQSTTGTLSLKVTALDRTGQELLTRQFDAVPVERNRITTIRGTFFSDVPLQYGFYVDDSWDGETVINF